MRPLRLVILLLLAAILVAEPIVHTHPIVGGGDSGLSTPSVCAICSVAAQQMTVMRVLIHAPMVVVDCASAAEPRWHSTDVPLPRASRAPPAA